MKNPRKSVCTLDKNPEEIHELEKRKNRGRATVEGNCVGYLVVQRCGCTDRNKANNIISIYQMTKCEYPGTAYITVQHS